MACKVSVIGVGYIGLPLAAMLANSGNNVVGVDINNDIIDSINSGISHIKEDKLSDLVRSASKSNHLRASRVVEPSDIFVITVPTPLTHDLLPDLNMVFSAIETLLPVVKDGDLIVIESTVSIGTTNKVLEFIKHHKPELDFNLAYCPERILPGDIVNELINNDRIIGGVTNDCSMKAMALYRTFVKGRLEIASAEVAESVKLVENTYRDINIGFANELSMLFHKLGINTNEVIKYANMHPRVNILKPGPGVGGHCIAIDPVFLANADVESTSLMQCARNINKGKEEFVLQQIIDFCNGNPEKDLYFYGLTYKPDVSDLRESPALNIARNLVKKIVNNMHVIEPNISELPEVISSESVTLTKYADVKDGLHVYLVAHKEFKNHKFKDLNNILDFCQILD